LSRAMKRRGIQDGDAAQGARGGERPQGRNLTSDDRLTGRVRNASGRPTIEPAASGEIAPGGCGPWQKGVADPTERRNPGRPSRQLGVNRDWCVAPHRRSQKARNEREVLPGGRHAGPIRRKLASLSQGDRRLVGMLTSGMCEQDLQEPLGKGALPCRHVGLAVRHRRVGG
jgi:hypothetical protein